MEIMKQSSELRLWIKKHAIQIAAFTFWMILLGGYQLYAYRNAFTPVQ